MKIGKGKITEIIAGFGESLSLRNNCALEQKPTPGQYLLPTNLEMQTQL
ncbi:MAG: hypothetical protein U9Q82_01955 [Chloroflexota bacterium]|nr:hypothetical protein [Chloroflexota bacterium]